MLTCNAREQLTRKALDLAVGKGHEAVALEEVKDALAQQIHDDANVPAVVEAIAQVDAAVAILGVVGLESGQDANLDTRGIAVLLDRPDDLDSHRLVASSVPGLHHLAKGALAEEACDLVCILVSISSNAEQTAGRLTLVRQIGVGDDNVVAVVVVDLVVLVVVALEQGRQWVPCARSIA